MILLKFLAIQVAITLVGMPYLMLTMLLASLGVAPLALRDRSTIARLICWPAAAFAVVVQIAAWLFWANLNASIVAQFHFHGWTSWLAHGVNWFAMTMPMGAAAAREPQHGGCAAIGYFLILTAAYTFFVWQPAYLLPRLLR